jgi:hypothetical protein
MNAESENKRQKIDYGDNGDLSGALDAALEDISKQDDTKNRLVGLGISWENFVSHFRCEFLGKFQRWQMMPGNAVMEELSEYTKEKLDLVQSSKLRLLWLENSELFQLQSEGTKSSHVDTSHKMADVEEKSFCLKRVPTDSHDFREVKWLSGSTFLCYAEDNGLHYSHEADIKSIVTNAISDAVFLCNELFRVSSDTSFPVVLSARRESNLLSFNKPDHTVIYDESSGVYVLTIEDKKPFKGIESKPRVAGQLFDFLGCLESFGHPNAIGVLTTFEKTWVAWLHGDNENYSETSEGILAWKKSRNCNTQSRSQ